MRSASAPVSFQENPAGGELGVDVRAGSRACRVVAYSSAAAQENSSVTLVSS